MAWLEMRVPPLVVTLCGALAMLATDVLWPDSRVSWMQQPWLALLLLAVGIGVALAGVLAFRRQRTSVNPLHGDGVATLVGQGVYRWTRNPMYLGFVLWLLSLAFWLGHAAVLAVPLLVVVWLTRWQIVPEERLLAQRFGQGYHDYCARVRRWI